MEFVAALAEHAAPSCPRVGARQVRRSRGRRPEQRLAELESLLADVKLDAGKLAPLLAPMVGIPLPADRLPSLSPEETRRGQLAAMVEWAIAGARNQPLVLVFEDLQWFDPTSIDLVQALERARRAGADPGSGDGAAGIPPALGPQAAP